MERVRIIDEVPYERLPELYAMSDLAVSFPILDAFPVTFLEASACEVPILTHHRIAYESHGMADFLSLMETEDPNSIGGQMAGLCSDPIANERARAARRHVARHYSETAFGRALIGAYETLLQDKLQRSATYA